MRLLAVTSVPAERDAVLAGLGVTAGTGAVRTPAGEVVVVVGGVGMAAAAATAAAALAAGPAYDAVASLGVAGGFDGRAAVGDVVVASEMVAADLGSWTAGGFRTLADLGLGASVLPAGPAARELAGRAGARFGPVVTVATVTGTDERAAELAARFGACAEAMEGYGVAVAAGLAGLPAYEVRTVSNRCGLRDRSGWELPRALAALSAACARLFRTPLPEPPR